MNSNLEQTIRLQQKASNPDVSAWVFASAGSGKTKILTDRVLRLLLEGVPPNKILCLTFTKVAATEMQHRINAELAEWILCDDRILNKKLTGLSGHSPSAHDIKKARTLFIKILDEEYKIKVQTIHSFCQTLIKIFPFEVNITPTFEVLEVNQEKLLLKQAQQEILKQASNNKELQNLIKETNAKLHEEGFNELIANLLNKKEQLNALKEEFFGIENVIAEIFTKFGIDQSQNAEDIFAAFLSRINLEKISDLGLALDTTGLVRNEAISDKLKKFLEESSLDNFSHFKSAFFTQKNEPRKIYGNVLKDETLANLIDDYRDIILEFSDNLNSFKIANDTALLLRFIDYILEHYSQLKRFGSFLDYNDLISETNRLLANPDFSDWVKMKMDGTFDHILIDESQDTNHQQWNIIKALSEDFYSGLSAAENKRSIFIVGDEKQSIYSFQGAEPNISAEIFAYFAEKLDGKLQKIELNNSFRSTQNILNAVDQVFSTENRRNAISKVSEFKAHQAIREGLGHVEIWPQLQKTKEEKVKEEKNYEWEIDFKKKDEESPEERLVGAIAQRINHWVEGKKILENKNRPIEYSDFMILLRNRTNNFNRLLTKSLHQYDIPFNSVSRVKFKNSLLIQDLLAIAQFCLLPIDDLNLACLLKSPIFAISEEALLEICLLKNNDKSSIFEAIKRLPTFSSIAQDLDEILAKSQQLSCFDFFYFLLHEKNYQKKFLAHFGHKSLEILDKFTLTIFDFCQNFSPNLQKLLEFIEKLDLEIPLSSNKGNSVQISTIHSAKGLQAPIVILPDCCYNFNQLLGAKEEVSWVELKGLKFPIWCRKKDDENRFLKTHRAKKLEEAKEEYLRLLYVAMTRAEDELYVGGFGNAKDPESWYEVMQNSISDAKIIAEEEFKITLKKISRTKEIETSHSATEEFLIEKPHYQNIANLKDSASQISQSQIKGRLIHKILEIIGKNFKQDKAWLLQIAQKLIAAESFLKQENKIEIYEAIELFIHSDQFAEIFIGDVRCEVEIAGSNVINRIDLLIIKDDELLIIDYKSDESVPDKIPQAYVDQLLKYQTLIENSSFGEKKKILSAILWVKNLKIQYI